MFEDIKKLNNKLIIPDGTKIIGTHEFNTDGIIELYIPASVEKIEDSAFQGSHELKKVVFADNSRLKKIGLAAFAFCESLISINLPSSLEEIEYKAFAFCKSLKTVRILGNTTKISVSTFESSPNVSLIYYGSEQDLKNNLTNIPPYDRFNVDLALPQNIIYKVRENINKIKESKNIELSLAESFEKTIKSLQKEGLFENVKSFDLDFNGKGINIKLNEMAYKDDYREYNKKGKEYIKYRDRTLRQQDVLICKLYQLKPVSFTFNDTTFTIKYDKASIGSYGFIWISFNAFKEQEQVGHGSIELYDFQWHIMDQLNKKVSTSLDFTRYEKKLNSGEIKYSHKIVDDVYDNADISRKDKETFINIFEKYLFEFLKPALYFDTTADNNNLYQTIRQNRRKKLNQVNSEVVNAQKKAEGSWRKEHFGVEGYEVGQTVEVFDGRTGDARSLGKIIKMTPNGTATIQLEDGTTIVRRNVENDEYVKLFQPFGRKYSVFDGDYRKKNLALPSTSTEDAITNRKKVLDLE